YLNKTLIIYMGISILIGSFIGGYGSRFMTDGGVNFVYGLMALIAAIMMLVHTKQIDYIPFHQVTFNNWLAASLASLTAIADSIVGAAVAFILVPIMLLVLKIPTRMTIASSLAITFISSIGSTAGKIMTGQILFIPAVVMIVASLIASPLGANAGKRMNTKI